MVDEDRDVMADVVAEDATPDDGGVVEDATAEAEPRLIDLAALKDRAKKAKTPEGRIKHALPFPLVTLECDVLVAPVNEPELYEQLFGGTGDGIAADDLGENVDEALIRKFILNCVVSPALDEEALTLIQDANTHEFNALGKFCLDVTMLSTTERIMERLGAMDSGAAELFSAGLRGRMNTSTPV